jgi:chorismate-pyruvate lyase
MTVAAEGGGALARARDLVAIFCPRVDDFGRLEAVDPPDVPPVPRLLLDHHSHMTVAMERHHGCLVGLRVVAERAGPSAGGRGPYAREILLVRPDGRVVQHGIVRIDLAAVDPQTADAIREGRLPLGRILLNAGLLCDVQDVHLLRIAPGAHLRPLLGGGDATVYGRVADIVIGGRPTVELLEIVAATDESAVRE